MTVEKNLGKLLLAMSPELIAGEFIFCSFEKARYGDNLDLEPIASVAESEGLTLVIPVSKADEHEIWQMRQFVPEPIYSIEREQYSVDRMTYTYPDLEWYTKKSKEEMLTPRCPYANVHRCPRYFYNLELLGKNGVTTEMAKEKIEELDNYWNESDLVPVVAEHDSGLSSSGDRIFLFSKLCPEISYDIFGLFAASLHRYADEIDREITHDNLRKSNNVQENDWRLQWAHVEPMHFVNCPVYSQLLTAPMRLNEKKQKDGCNEEDIIELKPNIAGLGLNLNALLRWIKAKMK